MKQLEHKCICLQLCRRENRAIKRVSEFFLKNAVSVDRGGLDSCCQLRKACPEVTTSTLNLHPMFKGPLQARALKS